MGMATTGPPRPRIGDKALTGQLDHGASRHVQSVHVDPRTTLDRLVEPSKHPTLSESRTSPSSRPGWARPTGPSSSTPIPAGSWAGGRPQVEPLGVVEPDVAHQVVILVDDQLDLLLKAAGLRVEPGPQKLDLRVESSPCVERSRAPLCILVRHDGQQRARPRRAGLPGAGVTAVPPWRGEVVAPASPVVHADRQPGEDHPAVGLFLPVAVRAGRRPAAAGHNALNHG